MELKRDHEYNQYWRVIVTIPALGIEFALNAPHVQLPAIDIDYALIPPHVQLKQIDIEYSLLVPWRTDPPTISLTYTLYPPVQIQPIRLGFQLHTPVAHMPVVDVGYKLNPIFAFVEPPNAERLARVMRCRLIADGQTDLDLIISSFNSRLNYGRPSYISVVVPNALSLVDDIDLRKTGTIIVDYGYKFPDGTESLTELGRVTLDNISQSQGASSFSVVLDGYLHDPNSVPKDVMLEKTQFINTTNGIRRVRAPISVTLRPGDRVTLPDSSVIVVGSITHTVSESLAQMEVSELENYDLLTDTNDDDQGDTVTDANGNVTPVLPWTISTDSSAIN